MVMDPGEICREYKAAKKHDRSTVQRLAELNGTMPGHIMEILKNGANSGLLDPRILPRNTKPRKPLDGQTAAPFEEPKPIEEPAPAEPKTEESKPAEPEEPEEPKPVEPEKVDTQSIPKAVINAVLERWGRNREEQAAAQADIERIGKHIEDLKAEALELEAFIEKVNADE